MMTTKKSTVKKSKKALGLIDEHQRSRREKPEYKEKFEALVFLFGENIDALRHFTTEIEIELEKLTKENEMLCSHLNNELSHAELFSLNEENPNITAHTKVGIAEWLIKNGRAGPSSNSFMNGLSASKKIAAKKSSNVRVEKYKAVRDFAIDEFLKGSWKSLAQARDALWPKVQEEARLKNTNLTTRTGPHTLYKWLRTYQKSSVT
jgi:hypothetical protein